MGTASEAEPQVVLVDDAGTPIGTAPKASVHTRATPRHLAFSCHLVGPDGRVLVTRRALTKAAFGGVWTNACCGHPEPGEPRDDAVRRRVREELGIDVHGLELVLPDFSYRAADAAGIVEHELCPVFVARIDRDPVPDPDEVADWAWAEPAALRAALDGAPWAFSPWLVLQAQTLPLLEAR